MVHFGVSFWIRVDFLFFIYSAILAFLDIYTVEGPVFYGSTRIFNPETMYAIMAWCFSIRRFLDFCSEWFHVYFRRQTFIEPCSSFSMFLIHLPFLLCSFSFHIWPQNRFASLASVYSFIVMHSPPSFL